MKNNYPKILLALLAIIFIVLAIDVQDTRLTWFLESVPVMITVPILLFTYKRFPLSNFAYTLIFIQSCILLYGGHYSYAQAPLGIWMSDLFGFTRNNYDKIGHFIQGFGPAIYAREVFIRCTPMGKGRWCSFNAFCLAMTVSALYEIIEWAASLSNPTDTEAFLGTQGYIWDTQTDMFMCMIGAIMALAFFRKTHNHSIDKINV